MNMIQDDSIGTNATGEFDITVKRHAHGTQFGTIGLEENKHDKPFQS